MLLLLTLTIKKTYNTNNHINFTVFNININLHFLNFLKNNTPIFYTGLSLGQCFFISCAKVIICSLSDHSCGYLSLLPSLLRSYGWNPGQRVYNWLGTCLRKTTGKADISFSEVSDHVSRTDPDLFCSL